jgi:hypothetical protein
MWHVSKVQAKVSDTSCCLTSYHQSTMRTVLPPPLPPPPPPPPGQVKIFGQMICICQSQDAQSKTCAISKENSPEKIGTLEGGLEGGDGVGEGGVGVGRFT